MTTKAQVVRYFTVEWQTRYEAGVPVGTRGDLVQAAVASGLLDRRALEQWDSRRGKGAQFEYRRAQP